MAPERLWRAVWPEHVPTSFDYPAAPAWWLLERNLPRFAGRVAVRQADVQTLAERRVLTYEALFRAARGIATGAPGAGCRPWSAGRALHGKRRRSYPRVPRDLDRRRRGRAAQPRSPTRPSSSTTSPTRPRRLWSPRRGAGARRARRDLGSPASTSRASGQWRTSNRLSPPRARPAQDGAVLLYTGGTTGTPKGALLTHRNLVANTIQFAEWYAFEPGTETSLGAIPMFHSGGMSGVMNVPLYAGATLVVLPRFAAPAVARTVSRYRVTRLFGVPAMFIVLLGHEGGRRADYSHLRACRTNAAPLPPSVKAAFDTLVGREVLIEGYGLTEASPLTHANPIRRAKAGSIGIPLPDTDARIVEDLDTATDVAPGAPGRASRRGPQVMHGYWRRPEETARVLADGWLRTGDVAVMDDEGYFRIVDRQKDVINTAGFKVWPREVEEALYAHPAVRGAAVIGVPDAYRGEAVRAYVVLDDAHRGRVTGPDLIAFCRERLTAYKVPRAVEFRPETPSHGDG